MMLHRALFSVSLALLAAGELLNEGADCWKECNKVQGPCDFCGDGLCCRYGWHVHEGGCDGFLGIEGRNHVCVAEPVAPPEPPKACSEETKKQVCVKERKGECMWRDNTCVDYVPPPKPKGCQCQSFGDPHVMPFCFDKKVPGNKKWDFFIPGEYVQLFTEDLTIHVREEIAPRSGKVTGNTAFAWTGNWFCGKTYELHMGSPLSDERWTSPETFEPRLIVHHSSYLLDRDNWEVSTTMQYEGVDAIIQAFRDDTCPMFTFEGGANFSDPDGEEEIKLTFQDGSVLDFTGFEHPMWGISMFLHLEDYNPDEVEGICKGDDPEPDSIDCPSLFTYYTSEAMPTYTGTHPRRESWTYQMPAGVMGHHTDDRMMEAAFCGNLPSGETPAPIESCDEDLFAEAMVYCSQCPIPEMVEECVTDACFEGAIEGGNQSLYACIGRPEIPTRSPTISPTVRPTREPAASPTPEPPQPCVMTPWGEWEECTTTCGEGVQYQVRNVQTPGAPDGAPCPMDTERTRICYIQDCPDPTPRPTPSPTAEPTGSPTIDCAAKNKTECKEEYIGICIWKKEDKECVPVPPDEKTQSGECSTHGDPHVRPFGNDKRTQRTWDFFMTGEWVQYKDGDNLTVHVRTEWAPRRSFITVNTGVAFTGDWTCGKTYELHMGNSDCLGKGGCGGWVSPTAWEPRLLVHDPSFANNPGGWDAETTAQYHTFDEILQGFKDQSAGCAGIREVKGGFNSKGEYITMYFADGSFVDFKEFIHPWWGLGFYIHVTEIPENVEGLCKEGAEGSTPDPLGCPSLFSYYPDTDGPVRTYYGFEYIEHAGARGPWTPEMGQAAHGCEEFPRPEPGWTPAPIGECDADLKATAEAYCADCEDEGMRHDCVFDICISGNLAGGDPVMNSCLNVPEIPTRLPTMPPTYEVTGEEEQCPDHEVQAACEASAQGCEWVASIETCQIAGEDWCTLFDGEKKECQANSECQYDKNAKLCTKRPVLTGCAVYEKKGECNPVPGCKWAKKKCNGTPVVLEGCAQYTGKVPCREAPEGCIWDKNAKTCSEEGDVPEPEGCQAETEPGACNALDGCKWKRNTCTGTLKPTAEANCSTDEYPALAEHSLKFSKAKGSIAGEVTGADETDVTCMCYEFCAAKLADDIKYWFVNIKNETTGKCFCYTDDFKSMEVRASSASNVCGGVTAEFHEDVLALVQ